MNDLFRNKTLIEKFPPSKPCSCTTCVSYCSRPGWWTVKEAWQAFHKGLANRMMLEVSPEMTFGVLAPAFKGNEGNVAFQLFSRNSCTFLKNELCELFGTGLQPLECRFCHHTRPGEGIQCHSEIEKEWDSFDGQELVRMWCLKIGKNINWKMLAFKGMARM